METLTAARAVLAPKRRVRSEMWMTGSSTRHPPREPTDAGFRRSVVRQRPPRKEHGERAPERSPRIALLQDGRDQHQIAAQADDDYGLGRHGDGDNQRAQADRTEGPQLDAA